MIDGRFKSGLQESPSMHRACSRRDMKRHVPLPIMKSKICTKLQQGHNGIAIAGVAGPVKRRPATLQMIDVRSGLDEELDGRSSTLVTPSRYVKWGVPIVINMVDVRPTPKKSLRHTLAA